MAGARRVDLTTDATDATDALAESAAPVRIQLLGGFAVSVGQHSVPNAAWRLRKTRSLIKLLALAPGHRMHRERLMELLWPDLDPDAAANNLYIALHVARRALAAGLGARSIAGLLRLKQHIISLESPASLWIDVEAFEAAATAARAAATSAAYQAALALYTGDLLPDDRYDDWVAGRREALRETYLSLLLALARRCEAERDYPAAIAALQRAVAAEPTREEAHVALMRLYARSGQHADALRQYAQLEEVLRRELDAEPDAESQRLHQEIMAARFPKEPPAPPAPPAPLVPPVPPVPPVPSHDHPSSAPPVPATPLPTATTPTTATPASATSSTPSPPQARRPSIPLVGRKAEASQLMAAWRAARYAPHLALITGEPGIGKTRLAREILARAPREGVATAAAHCHASAGELAYAPVAAWLRSDALWPALVSLDDLWLTEVARVVPELLVERPSLPQPGPLTERWQRQRLFEALRRALTASGKPLLLLLDDIHWSDDETLEWLHHLLRADVPAPLLVIATLRPGELGDGHPVPAILADLRHHDQVTEVEPRPLDLAETAALAAKLRDRSLPPPLAARLFAESEGSPLFVVQLVRAGYVERWESEDDPVAGTAEIAPALPPTLHSAIAARLAQLSPAARDLTGLAATIGREFPFDLLAHASQAAAHDEDALVRGVEELLQRRIVREHPTGDYDFTHDKIREVAYASLSAARRRSLHRRVARALEAVHAGALDAVSGQIATHYLKAGEPARAVIYLERAGDQARRLYANADAEAYYRDLVKALEKLGREGDAARVRETLGRVLTLAARFDAALEQLESAVAHYRRSGDAEGVGRTTARIGLTHSVRGSPAEGIERVRSLVDSENMSAYSPQCRASLFTALAQLYGVIGRYHEQLESAQQAVTLARSADDRLAFIHAGRLYGLALLMLSRPTEALRMLDEVIPLAEAHDDLSNLCFALNNAGIAHMVLGHLETSREYADRSVVCARRLGSPATSAFMHSTLAEVAYLLGDWDAAQRDLEAATQVLAPVGTTWASANPLLGLGRLALVRGQSQQAEHYLLACIATAQSTGSMYPLQIAVLTLAERDLLAGQPEAVLRRVAPLMAEAGDAETPSGEVLAMLALAELALGHEDAAAELIERSLSAGAAAEHALVLVSALLAQSRLAVRRQRWDEAFAALEEALARTRASGARYAEATVLYDYGQAHQAKSEPDLARQRFLEALAILTPLGERLYAEHVERALQTLA